jgi:hypothetical protein
MMIHRRPGQQERWEMLYTIAVVLLVLWLLGMMTSYNLGGFTHLLLAIAVIVVLFRLILGRRAL